MIVSYGHTAVGKGGSSTEAVAKRSRHKTAHVLDLFADENPNPSLRLYLELASVAGARFGGVQDTTPAAVVAHLATVAKDNEITLASLARASSVGRPLLSTLFNDPDPNPSLATIDRIVTALDATSDFDLVPATQATGDEDEDQADDDDGEEADDGEAEAEAEDDEAEAEDDEAEAEEAEDGEAEDDEANEEDEAEDGEAEDGEAEDDEAEDDEAEDDEAEDDEANDSEADEDDGARRDEQAALREQYTQLQRRVVTKEAEIDHLREQGRWSTLKKLATAIGDGLVGAGITAAVLKRRKD